MKSLETFRTTNRSDLNDLEIMTDMKYSRIDLDIRSREFSQAFVSASFQRAIRFVE